MISVNSKKILELLCIVICACPLVASNHRYDYSTDGYYDQNDAENNRSFGTKRYRGLIGRCWSMPMEEQRAVFEHELEQYRSGEEQRDDITVLGFRL